MQAPTISQLETLLSTARLGPYYAGDNPKDPRKAIGRYRWNVALAGAFDPVFCHLEVGLRNRLHNAIARLANRTDWYDQQQPYLLEQRERESLQKVRQDLAWDRKPDTPDDIVARHSFGFWTSLLGRAYEPRLWPPLLAEVFPQMPRRDRTRANVSRRFQQVRTLRNRLSHHEPVWHIQNLSLQYNQALDALGWLDAALAHLLPSPDVFDTIYRAGPEAYEIDLGT